jgi:DNA polymerase-3 subunit delta'
LIFDFFELYFSKTNKNFFLDFNNKYSYFVKRMSDMKRFNLDKESLFIEFEETMLNG